jgi:hypothetical protein
LCREHAGAEQLVTSKFVDGLPIYRSCRQLERQQVHLSPGIAGTWVNTLGSESVVPLINLMNDELLAEGLIQMDETSLSSDPSPATAATLRATGLIPSGISPDTDTYEHTRGAGSRALRSSRGLRINVPESTRRVQLVSSASAVQE